MPLFYLHLSELGSILRDDEGLDLPDVAAARRAAVKGARDIMASDLKEGLLCLSHSILIENAGRMEIARIPFREAVNVVGII